MQSDDERFESDEKDSPGFGPGDPETREVSFRRIAGDPAPFDDRPEDEQDPNLDEPAEDEEERDADSIREEFRDEFQLARGSVREGEPRRCSGIAGRALPPRSWAGLEGGELPSDVQSAATAFSVGRATENPNDFDHDATRVLPGGTLAFFEPRHAALEGWQPLWIEADDAAPFALMRAIGSGRLVVAADARVLTNDRLAKLDSAPFVIDWVEDWGVPWIDEHRHGLVPESGTFRYLAKSPAAPASAGLLVLGLLFLWRGRAWPPREVEEVDPDAPTLAAFVESVAALYAETGDHQTAFERYRQLTLDRIRRTRGMSGGASEEVVLATLRARFEARVGLEERGLMDLLSNDVVIRDAEALERAVERLDHLVDVVRQ